MEARAIGKQIRVQPRKTRLVADEIRGKHAIWAMSMLRYHPSKSARVLRKVLRGAIANAVENNGMSADALVISKILIDEGPRLKRYKARAMGRGNRIIKKTSHIKIELEEKDSFVVNRSKAKPKTRPKLDWPKAKKEKKTKEEETAATVETQEASSELLSEEIETETQQEPETPQEGTTMEETEGAVEEKKEEN